MSEPGKPSAASSAACAFVGEETSPTIASEESSRLRAAAGPCASGLPSVARIGARGGARVRRVSRSPSVSPG